MSGGSPNAAGGTTQMTGGASPASGAGGKPSPGGAGGSPTSGAGGGGASGGSSAGSAANGRASDPIVTHIYTADPSAHVFEGRIYVYASHDEDNQSAYDMVDYHVFSSDDLANWQDHGVVLDKARVPWVKYFYAPDCCYSPKTKKYYLYFPNTGENIGVAVGDTPVGPFQDPLGKALVSRSTPGVGDVEWVFDPACFIDDDGQGYLYFGGGMPGTGDNARVIRLNDDMVSLKDASATTIVAPDFFEASFLHKRGGLYYFSYSTTFQQHAPAIDYMVSDNPISGFQFKGTALPNPADNEEDNNHHSFVEFQGNSYVFYHTRSLAKRDGKSKFQRSITLDNLTYAADGSINAPSGKQGNVRQLKAGNARARWEAETMADQHGIEVDFAEDAGQPVGVKVTQIQNGDWISYSQLDFGADATTFRAKVASNADGPSSIVIILSSCSAPSQAPDTNLASCAVAPTGGWQSWAELECSIPSTSGVHDLCLRFSGGSGELLHLDYFQFD